MKVSLHAMGISGLLMAVILVGLYYPVNNLAWILLVIILAALVMSARMVVSDHTKNELMVGFAIGLFTQLVAFVWIL
jgi:apolipoprotein N-acyltransferase